MTSTTSTTVTQNTTSAATGRLRPVHAAQLAVLLDVLDGVPLTDAERHTLEWLAGWEVHTVENIAAVIRRSRAYQKCHHTPAVDLSYFRKHQLEQS